MEMRSAHRRPWLQRRAVVAASAAVVLMSSQLIRPSAAQAQSADLTERCAAPSHVRVREVPWAQDRLLPKRVWNLTQGAGVTVAVIDSGIDASVPQLAGRVLPGVDVVGSGPADTDCLGHGTFVAGVIAAQPAPGTGLAGVAPQAKVLPIRQAISADDGSVSDLAEGIRAAVDGGATVINVSASSFRPSLELQAAVQYASLHDALIVAAVSNAADAGSPTAYPAAYPEVLAVGAIDRDGQRGQFSESGEYLDLVAPGVGVTGLSRGGPGHVVADGASFAAPFVAGVAALVRSKHPDLTAAQVKHRLEVTADHPGAALPDPNLGWGVVNPWAAVTMVLTEESGQPTTGRTGPAQITPARRAVLDRGPQHLALAMFAAAAVLAAAVAAAAVTVPPGMRRRWTPAHLGAEKRGARP
jgi:membrane-anchored mycosin MYCP